MSLLSFNISLYHPLSLSCSSACSPQSPGFPEPLVLKYRLPKNGKFFFRPVVSISIRASVDISGCYMLFVMTGRRDATCPIMPRAATGGVTTTEELYFTLISPGRAHLHAGLKVTLAYYNNGRTSVHLRTLNSILIISRQRANVKRLGPF